MIANIEGLDRYQACSLLFPYMVHPKDVDRRGQLKAWLEARILREKGMTVDSETVDLLIEAAKVGVGNDIADAVNGGCVAGQVLIAIISMNANNERDAGLDKAQHIVSQIYQGAHDHKGKPLRLGRDSIRKHWNSYRPVAHLWAALVTLLANALDGGRENDTAVWTDLWFDGLKLADLAYSFQRKAAEISLPRNGGAILPNVALEIVGANLVQIPLESSNNAAFASIDSFEPRFRQ